MVPLEQGAAGSGFVVVVERPERTTFTENAMYHTSPWGGWEVVVLGEMMSRRLRRQGEAVRVESVERHG